MVAGWSSGRTPASTTTSTACRLAAGTATGCGLVHEADPRSRRRSSAPSSLLRAAGQRDRAARGQGPRQRVLYDGGITADPEGIITAGHEQDGPPDQRARGRRAQRAGPLAMFARSSPTTGPWLARGEAPRECPPGTVRGMARFKELCLDTDRADSAIAEFWAAVTGCRCEGGSGGLAGRRRRRRGARRASRSARCPEPKTVKNRVHLDVYTRSSTTWSRSARRCVLPAEESGFGWTMMLDPEGNEFCAFVRDELPAYRVHGLVVDCADAGGGSRAGGPRRSAPSCRPDAGTAAAGGPSSTRRPTPVLTWDFAPGARSRRR